MTTDTFAAGGYRYIPAVFQYSGRVAAEPGFEILRVRFREGVALPHGLARLGETSPDAIREKARAVLGEMERRLAALGFGWADTTATQVYTVHDIHPFLADELVRRGAMASGLTWHFNRPPVRDLEYEMDCRGVMSERLI